MLGHRFTTFIPDPDESKSDFEKLLHIMYRLDIDESKFISVISGTYGNDVSGKLAEIVIERELKKMETRNRYKDD